MVLNEIIVRANGMHIEQFEKLQLNVLKGAVPTDTLISSELRLPGRKLNSL